MADQYAPGKNECQTIRWPVSCAFWLFTNNLANIVKVLNITLCISFQTEILDDDKRMISAVDYYFIQEDGNRFKVWYYSSLQV